MVVFPLLSTLISLACAAVIARDASRRPRPDKIAWVVAFAVFAVAAGAESLGALTEWTPTLARVYYLTGAVLVVGYLALGELYLLAGRRIARFAPGATLLVTALAAAVVWDAPIDEARLAEDGWEALERGPGLIVLAVTINSLGTVVLAGGALASAWTFKRLGVHRHRMIGCVLIAVGTLIVAFGGTLTRLGHREYFYIAMSLGVATIFAGYLATRRSDAARPVGPAGSEARPATLPSPPLANGHSPADRPAGANGRGGAPAAAAASTDPAIAFIEERFLPLDDAALTEACRVWSCERRPVDAFTREEARRVWALRLRLSPAARDRFDAHTVPARLHLAALYDEVLAPGVAERSSGGPWS